MLAKLQAAGTRGRGGLLAVLGGDDAFGSEASDKANERKRKVDAAIARTEEHDTLLTGPAGRGEAHSRPREEPGAVPRGRGPEAVTRGVLLPEGVGQGRRGPRRDEANATIRGRGGSRGAHATRSRPGGSAPEVLRLRRRGASADVSALRRQHADTLAAISPTRSQRARQKEPGHRRRREHPRC